MNRFIFYNILVFITTFNVTGFELAEPDSLVSVNCQLKDLSEKHTIPYAHIVNSRLGIGTTSDSLGFFSIYMRRDDSLFISAIGFEDKYFFLPQFWPSNHFAGIIHVREKVYLIKGVSVQVLGSYQQFKQKVLNAKPPKSPAEEAQEYLREISNEEAIKWDKVRVGINFSVKTLEERSLIKLKELLAAQEKKKMINNKFNEGNIGELTGLKGKELQDFMNYCNLPEDFLLNSSEYDVLVEVKNIYRGYMNRKVKRR